MKIVRTERLIDAGGFSRSEQWREIEDHIKAAVSSIQWPPGSGSFTLYDESGKKPGEGSGVKPIKEACMQTLRSLGWRLETPVDIATVKKPGPMDATYGVGGCGVVIEVDHFKKSPARNRSFFFMVALYPVFPIVRPSVEVCYRDYQDLVFSGLVDDLRSYLYFARTSSKLTDLICPRS